MFDVWTLTASPAVMFFAWYIADIATAVASSRGAMRLSQRIMHQSRESMLISGRTLEFCN